MIEPNKDCRFVGRYYTIMCGILFYYIYGGKIEQVSAFDYFLGKHQIFDLLFSDCHDSEWGGIGALIARPNSSIPVQRRTGRAL